LERLNQSSENQFSKSVQEKVFYVVLQKFDTEEKVKKWIDLTLSRDLEKSTQIKRKAGKLRLSVDEATSLDESAEKAEQVRRQ